MFELTARRLENPVVQLRELSNRLSRLFEGDAPRWRFGDVGGTLTSAWVPPCDVFEDRDAIRIVAEIPGVKSKDVEISLENNLLTIRGEKKQENRDESGQVHRYERTYGVFERTFALPSTVNVDKIEARYDDGVLTVTLPKVEQAHPRQIKVKAS